MNQALSSTFSTVALAPGNMDSELGVLFLQVSGSICCLRVSQGAEAGNSVQRVLVSLKEGLGKAKGKGKNGPACSQAPTPSMRLASFSEDGVG